MDYVGYKFYTPLPFLTVACIMYNLQMMHESIDMGSSVIKN